MNQPHKLPKRILIIGLLFIVYGVWNLVDTLYHLAHSQLSLNFMIFTLPVGIGLISGKSSSRWWARAWIIVGYLICAYLACIALSQPVGTVGIGSVLLDASLTAIGLYVIHRLLFSPKANEHFRRGMIAVAD